MGYIKLGDDEPTVQEKPDGTAKYIFNPIQGNWYNTYNIDITAPTPEDERDCCDKCVDCYENCVKKCAKVFLKIAKIFVIFIRCFIDPCQACVVGGLILFAHCLQVCVLDHDFPVEQSPEALIARCLRVVHLPVLRLYACDVGCD